MKKLNQPFIVLSASIFFSLFSTLLLTAQTNYYVSTTGSNSNSGLSLNAPWLTIQHALDNVSTGGIINVLEGNYNEKLAWKVSGTASNPTTLQNYNGHLVTILGTGITSDTDIISIDSKSHLVIKGLTLENNYMSDANGIYVRGTGENITIEDCIVKNIGFTNNVNTVPSANGDNAHGIIVVGLQNPGYHNITINNNELYDLITGFSESLTITGNVYDFVIDNNVVHNTTNIGIDIAGHYSWVQDAGAPAALNQARNGIVSNNKVYDNRRPNNTDSPAGIYADGSKDIIIEKNICFRNGNGLSVGCENSGKSAEQIMVRNNFVFDNDNNGIVFGSNAGTIESCTLSNNTFLKNGSIGNFRMEVSLQKSTDCLIGNNIFFARSISHYAIGIFGYATTNLTIQYNNVFREGGNSSNLIIGGDGAPTPVHTFTSMTDPRLIKQQLPSPDLHLQSTSPAINQGNNAFLSSGEKDIDEGTRQLGTKVDRGADEYNSEGCLAENKQSGIIPTGSYQANTILSNGVVESTAAVSFLAQNITLSPGFHATAGSSFTVTINSCNNALPHRIKTNLSLSKIQETSNDDLSIYPNPFINRTTIGYYLKEKTVVSINFLNANGQLIQTILNKKTQDSGWHQTDLNRLNLPPGIYFIQLQTSQSLITKKIIRMK